MPIAVKRNTVDTEDVTGKSYTLPYFNVFVFKKEIPILLFYMSKGIKYTLDYLNIADVVSFIDKLPNNLLDDYYYFQLSSKCFIQVDKEMFDKYPYIKSIVGGFITICSNRVTLDQLDDPKQWIKKIANPNNYEKGYGILKYFNRLLDETTKKVLKIPEYHSKDIYALLRWMMEEFNELRLKDNLDLGNKRLRCNEYISSLLTKEFSKRLNRIISMGDKCTIDNIKELFRFSGDIIKIIRMSPLNLSNCGKFQKAFNY